MPTFSAIVAMAENRVIGHNNRLPWHLPADLKRFKAITTQHAILMGRKTYEAIGKPLANRTNIILSRSRTFTIPGCIVADALDSAMHSLAAIKHDHVFVIGGAELYKQCLPHVQTLYLTLVHHAFKGDTYFPELNAKEWKEVSREDHQPDREHAHAYSFLKLERIGASTSK
jgi:dihydrofolate reductase